MQDLTPKTITASVLIMVGWLLLLAAVPAYAFFWRVDNEPGAAKIPELLWAAICFLTSGGFTFLAANFYLIAKRSKAILIAWGICLLIAITACSLSPILLLFMV